MSDRIDLMHISLRLMLRWWSACVRLDNCYRRKLRATPLVMASRKCMACPSREPEWIIEMNWGLATLVHCDVMGVDFNCVFSTAK